MTKAVSDARRISFQQDQKDAAGNNTHGAHVEGRHRVPRKQRAGDAPVTVTRKEHADTIEGCDLENAYWQERKAYQDYREQLSLVMGKDRAKAEVEAMKLALKRRHVITKQGVAAIEDKDALVDEILREISGTQLATHVARSLLRTWRAAREPTAVNRKRPATHPRQTRELSRSRSATRSAIDDVYRSHS